MSEELALGDNTQVRGAPGRGEVSPCHNLPGRRSKRPEELALGNNTQVRGAPGRGEVSPCHSLLEQSSDAAKEHVITESDGAIAKVCAVCTGQVVQTLAGHADSMPPVAYVRGQQARHHRERCHSCGDPGSVHRPEGTDARRPFRFHALGCLCSQIESMSSPRAAA